MLHHNFNHIYPSLAVVQSYLLGILELKLERVVDLGPFKHKVDDALVIRKTSLACIEEILASSVSSVSLTPFIESLIEKLPTLLSDKDDIKLDVYQVYILFPFFIDPYNIIECILYTTIYIECTR
jgi:cullin-associated NEDD8-dissociated protein 1